MKEVFNNHFPSLFKNLKILKFIKELGKTSGNRINVTTAIFSWKVVERWYQITKIFMDKICSFVFIYGNTSSQKTYFPDIFEIQRIGCRSLKLINANFLLSNSENYSCNLHTSIWCFTWSYATHGVGRWGVGDTLCRVATVQEKKNPAQNQENGDGFPDILQLFLIKNRWFSSFSSLSSQAI